MQSVFALKIKKSFAEWTVVAFFNPGLTEAMEKKFALERLWLNPAKTYIAFDFWQQHLAGEITKEIAVTIEPGNVVLLALHEKTGNPQFISTDRHLLQGAVEMENIIWNEDTKAISGTSIGPLNTSHNVFLYVPKEYPWTWSGSGLFQDHDDYSLKLYDKHVIRVHVNFNKAGKVNWEIKPDDFSK